MNIDINIKNLKKRIPYLFKSQDMFFALNMYAPRHGVLCLYTFYIIQFPTLEVSLLLEEHF